MGRMNVGSEPLALFEKLRESLSKHESNVAFCIDGNYYSYGDLRKRTVGIQAKIVKEYPKGGARLGIVTRNAIDTYASFLACWFSGNSYVPINQDFPLSRNLEIIDQADISYILDSTSDNSLNLPPSVRFIDTRHHVEMEDGDFEIIGRGSDSELYILFTSGSTGSPKGVPISYGNVSAFVDSWNLLAIPINGNDRCLQMFDLTFDVSIACFLLPLLSGAQVYTVPPHGIKYLNAAKIIMQYELTIITIVPSLIALLKPYLSQLKFSRVRNCLLTAEATQVDLLEAWRQVVPNAMIRNLYGPTETTIWVSCYTVDSYRVKNYNGMLSIGKLFGGATSLIINEYGNPVAEYEKGELLISGPQLTSGYLNCPEKNAVAFLVFTIGNKLVRFYRTGDLCYKDEVGDLYYCGRIDNQVKIQGYRVELSEIEYLVRQEFDLNCATVVSNRYGTSEIVLVLESTTLVDTAKVLSFLKKKLPYYMVPARIASIGEFPIGTSGKVDRRQILSMIG